MNSLASIVERNGACEESTIYVRQALALWEGPSHGDVSGMSAAKRLLGGAVAGRVLRRSRIFECRRSAKRFCL